MADKVTVWQTFFMLLTVIPASKMLSSIFMKLIARVGTVDEEKWAAIGIGSLGGLAGMYALGKVSMQALGKRGIPPVMGTGGNAGIPGGNVSGGTSSGDAGTPFDSLVQNVSNVGRTAAVAGGVLGGIGSAPVPEVAPAVAGITGAAAKMASMPLAAAYGIGKTLYQGVRDRGSMSVGEVLGGTAMQLTGAQSVPEATARLIGTVLGSPLGGWGARVGSNIMGAPVRWASDLVSRPSWTGGSGGGFSPGESAAGLLGLSEDMFDVRFGEFSGDTPDASPGASVEDIFGGSASG
ncbi:hypothetical protein SAMN02745218_01212 [Desulfofundulus australicus DSM 11792]|uniref:Uncharacterized protein n=1 Tax=Desulfofundulus australicus DSM 11792 TaxID=1121425 RepID=A0A1M4XY61_9FIRM|nr:hypothetical protein [Desulfofundulus australicus]SHE98368.1 hypothetical protein SAMN02745218_01212 [Desulfofundulus australicus DSM 11792]